MSDFFNKAKRVVFEDGQSLKVGSQAEINRIPRGRGKPDWWVVEDDESRQEPKPSSKSTVARAKPSQPRQPRPEGLQVVFEDGRTKPIASEAETRDIPRGKGHPDWWVAKRTTGRQPRTQTRQNKPSSRRDGTLLSQGGAGMKTRGMKVPIGGPLGGPLGVAWDVFQAGKSAVDEYGRRMSEGEKYAQEQLEIEFDANVDNVRDCVDDCIHQGKGADCMDRCNIPYTKVFNEKMKEQAKIPKWPFRWLFEKQEK